MDEVDVINCNTIEGNTNKYIKIIDSTVASCRKKIVVGDTVMSQFFQSLSVFRFSSLVYTKIHTLSNLTCRVEEC